MFVAYDVSIELVRALRPAVASLETHDNNLAMQLRDAASSIALNLGEGRRRRGGDPRRCYGYAHGSAIEVKAALEVAEAWGWAGDATAARVLLDRLLGLLWGLTR